MTATTDQSGALPEAPRFVLAACVSDIVRRSLRHAQDVTALVDLGPHRWSDALASETRVHLAGCLNAVEIAIGLQLGEHWLAKPVQALGPNHCSTALDHHPGLLSPLLVEHFRQRAAAALVLRMGQNMPTDLLLDEPASETDSEALLSGALSDALTTLRLSIDPWFAPHPIDLPMRADLAAEPFAELAWTAAALLIDGLVTRMGVEAAAACPAVGRATESVVAHHDEQTGPFARAAYAAALIRDRAVFAGLAEKAVMDRNLLLLGALGARRCGMRPNLALTLLIDGTAPERAAFAHKLGLGEDAFAALLTCLAPISLSGGDMVLVDGIAFYREMSQDAVDDWLVRWSGPEALVEKLARIDWSRS